MKLEWIDGARYSILINERGDHLAKLQFRHGSWSSDSVQSPSRDVAKNLTRDVAKNLTITNLRDDCKERLAALEELARSVRPAPNERLARMLDEINRNRWVEVKR